MTGPIAHLIPGRRTRKPWLSLIAAALLGLAASAALSAPVERAGAVEGATPVVLLIFDEFPTATLMDENGDIDADRYPGFAELAARGTWYPENSTVADFTGRAVPAILTGNSPDWSVLPTAAEQPNSIFTLLGSAGYAMHVQEPITELCPDTLCPGTSTGTTAPDSVTYSSERYEVPKASQMNGFIREIPDDAGTLNVMHALLPHEPYRFLPDGRAYHRTDLSFIHTPGRSEWEVGRTGIDMMVQRHYLQVGYADLLVGRMIRRLEDIGLWDRAMVIVTADHGVSFKPRTVRREAQGDNLGGVANPPLFIKYPGQRAGEVSPKHTRSVDILPTIARRLGIADAYPMQGRPIETIGSSRPIDLTNLDNRTFRKPLKVIDNQRRRTVRMFAHDLGTGGLWSLGPRSNLIGRRKVGGRPARVSMRRLYRKVRPGAGRIPAFVTGSAPGTRPRRVVAIRVNRVVAATTRTFRYKGGIRYGVVIPPDSLHRGRNRISATLLGRGVQKGR